MKTKIIKDISLDKYLEKYNFCLPYLSKFTKKDVLDYYNHRKHENKPTNNIELINEDILLEGKKWCLINDTYYRIPDKIHHSLLNNKKYAFIDNIVYGYDLDQYNKKYHNHKKVLLKYSEEQLINFDKTYCSYLFEGKRYYLHHRNNYLLMDSKWCYINGTYYEIPERHALIRKKNKEISTKDHLNNVIYGLTYDQYNKKYRHRRNRLLKYSEEQLINFDDSYCSYLYEGNKYYLDHPNDYLIKNGKWCYIDDTYYEIPKPPRLTWYVNLKRKTQILTASLACLFLLAAISVPTVLVLTDNVISRRLEELLPKDKETSELIAKNVDVSNTIVRLGEDFKTNLAVKAESRIDYSIDSINIYTYKNNPVSSSDSNDLVRIRLEKDKDFITTISDDEKEANVCVYSASFNNKLELDIKLKDSSFNNIVIFDNYTKSYDESAYEVQIKVKKGKKLPEGTLIKYTYNDSILYDYDHFKFVNCGTYKVDVEITAPKFVTYNKSINIVINKVELPDSEKNKIYFNEETLTRKKGEIAPPEVVKDSTVEPITQTQLEYLINGSWTKELPTENGKYRVRTTFSFLNYSDYTIEDDFRIEPWAEIKITFKLPYGAKWKIGGSSEDKVSSTIEVLRTGTSFKLFKESAGVDANPIMEGHDFLGWYYEDTYFGDDSLVKSTEDFDVTAKFKVNSYNLKFDGNGGTAPTTSIQLDYGKKIKENIIGVAPATHDYAAFKCWGENSESREEISDTITMPASEKTLYAVWYKYNFKFIDGEHGKVSGTTEYKSLIKLDNKPKEVVITPDEGYEFTNKYEILVGGVPTIDEFEFDGSNKLAPGKFNSPVKEDGAVISIKPIFEAKDYLATFEPDGGTIKIGDKPISSLNIKCDSKIFDSLTGISATRNYTQQIGWLYNDVDLTDQTMPARPITIRPKWHKYTIKVLAENGIISEDTKTFNDCLELYSDQIKLTPTSGYVLDHFEYSFDNSTYSAITYGMPFRPYQYEIDTSKLHSTIYLKAVCTKPVETMEVILSAGEGLFNDGKDSVVINVSKGKTLNEILAITGTPKKDSAEPSKWVDEDGSTIDPTAQITGVDRFYAEAKYGE